MACWIVSALLCAAVGGSSDCTIVHFTADRCEPCKQIEPALQQLRQDGWTIQTVDVERQRELVQQFHIENLPTLAIVCRDQEVDRIVGAASYQLIQQRVVRAAARNQSGSPRGSSQGEVVTNETDRRQFPEQTLEASQPAAQPPAAIVRGQSPEMSGFPLLASAAGTSGASLADPTFAQEEPAQRSVAQLANSQSRSAAPAMNSMSAPVQGGVSGARTASSARPALSVEQAIARSAAATVRIRVDEANSTAYGTGTIVDVRGQEALILTCGHLFRDMQPHSQLTIDLFPGTAQEVNLPSELIDFKAEGEDIGLISFRLPVPIEPVPILGRGQVVSVGQPAFSFGCDRGANPTRRDTQIKNIDRYLGAGNIEIVGAPVVGRSGGGLFDTQGRLIGVCNAANAEDDEGIYASVEVIYTQIERLGLSELFQDEVPSAVTENPVQFASAVSGSTQSGSSVDARNTTVTNWQAAVIPAAVNNTQSGEGQASDAVLEWPDQSASAPNATSGQLARGAVPALGKTEEDSGIGGRPPINASNTRQVICIVRDAGGQDQVVTIDAPPEQLLQMIQQQRQMQGQSR